MAKTNERIPCGGFDFDNTVFEFKTDPDTGRPSLTVTANVPTSGADFILLTGNDGKQYKVTVTDGALKADVFNS